MRNSPSPKNKTEEPDPARIALLNLIKKNLKVDILEKLTHLVFLDRFRVSILKSLLLTGST